MPFIDHRGDLKVAYLLGIDIGTHESKGVLVAETGRIVATVAVPHETARPQPGWAEHDADEVWWHDAVAMARELPSRAGIPAREIAAVACSAIGPCVLPVDANGRPLRPGILYGIDNRATEQVGRLTAELTEAWIVAETGSALSSQAAGPKVLWIRDHEPHVWAATRRLMTATSYLVYRFTGRVVIDHYTAAAYGPMYSLRRRDWVERGLRPICTRSMLPDLEWSTAIAGVLNRGAAAETGLAEGTPVTVGTADAAAEAVAASVLDPGDTMLMYGTSMFFIQICDRRPSSRVQWPTVYLVPGTYALAGGMSTAGALLTWFRDVFAAGLDGADAITTLAAEAAAAPRGAGGVLALPYFSGERTPVNDPLARGIIAGLTLSHGRSHIYRSFMEAIAYGIRQNLDAMADAGMPARRLVAIGGGARNPLLVQIVSDVTGREQEVHASVGAAYGNAMMAAVGVGILEDLSATRTWVGTGPIVRPDPEASQFYDRRYLLYRQLYDDTADLMHTLASNDA